MSPTHGPRDWIVLRPLWFHLYHSMFARVCQANKQLRLFQLFEIRRIIASIPHSSQVNEARMTA
jgi:hypothetical protein